MAGGRGREGRLDPGRPTEGPSRIFESDNRQIQSIVNESCLFDGPVPVGEKRARAAFPRVGTGIRPRREIRRFVGRGG